MARSLLTTGLVLVIGCAGSAQHPPPYAARAELGVAEAQPPQSAASPVATAAQQKATHPAVRDRAELALQARSDRELRAYQIAQLRRTLALYQQFLERAGDQPEYALVVRRSRQQIEDAQALIAWLEQAPDSGPNDPESAAR